VGTEYNKQNEKKKNYNKTMSFESNSNVRKIGRGIALNGRSVCVQALMGDYYECVTFSTKDGQGMSSNNSCHIYPTAQQVHVY